MSSWKNYGSRWSDKSWEISGGKWWRSERRNYSSRLGFGDDTYSSENYSYYRRNTSNISSDKSLDSLRLTILSEAYSHARDLVNILDFPFRLNIYFDQNGWRRNISFHRMGGEERSIFIPTNCLNSVKSSITDQERSNLIKIISGNSLHEAAHLSYTSLRDTSKFFGSDICDDSGNILGTKCNTDFMKNFFKSFGITDDKKMIGLQRYMYVIFNTLEDERVETQLLEERNGWFDYIHTYKYSTYSKYIPTSYISSSSDDERIDIFEFLKTFIEVIRFPEKIDKKRVEKYSIYLERIQNYIHTESTLGCCLSSLQILKFVLLNLIDKEEIEKISENIEEEERNVVVPDDIINNFDSLLDIIKSSGTFVGSDRSFTNNRLLLDQVFKNSISMDGTFLDIITGELDGSIDRKVSFEKPVGSIYDYNKIKKEIDPYVPIFRNMVRNINKNYDFTIYGQRNGKLDTSKLAEAYQGVSQVYIRKGMVRTEGMTICILLDESGSMYGSREINARKAGILLNEAFGFMKGINLFIYGHTADQRLTGNTEIFIYREPGFNSYGKRLGCGLTEVSAKYENRDGVAIKEVAQRVRKFTQQPVLMFILSDGMPSADDYRGTFAVQDTKRKVEEVEKMGFHTIQVTIDNHSCHPEQMFKTYVDLTKSVDNLHKALGTVVKNKIVEILNDNQTITQI